MTHETQTAEKASDEQPADLLDELEQRSADGRERVADLLRIPTTYAFVDADGVRVTDEDGEIAVFDATELDGAPGTWRMHADLEFRLANLDNDHPDGAPHRAIPLEADDR